MVAGGIVVSDGNDPEGRTTNMTTTTTLDEAAAPSGICSRCHRVLKDPKSIERGRGKVCERKYRAAIEEATKQTSDSVVDKALTLLANGGVVKNDQDSFYTVTSGDATYRTDRALCTCLAGQNGRVCAHRLAVNLVEVKAVKLL
jgi:Family of unknown function (DUF6011)/SWIM zinc finger